MSVLARNLELDDEATRTTMGLARPIPANRDALVAAGRRRVILDHPAGYAPVCDEMVAILGRAGWDGSDPDVGRSFLSLASMMDVRRPDTCLPRLLAVWPSGPGWSDAVRTVRTECEYGKPPGGARCAKITR